MEDKPEGRKESRELGMNIVSKSFGILMVVLYIAIGTTIIFRAPAMRNIPENYAVAFGILLILYGIFRGYKFYRKYFQ